MMFSRLCSVALVSVLPAVLIGAGIQSAKPIQPEPAARERIETLAAVAGQPAVRKGTVEGHASQSYVVAGRKGQKLTVDLRSTNSSLSTLHSATSARSSMAAPTGAREATAMTPAIGGPSVTRMSAKPTKVVTS